MEVARPEAAALATVAREFTDLRLEQLAQQAELRIPVFARTAQFQQALQLNPNDAKARDGMTRLQQYQLQQNAKP